MDDLQKIGKALNPVDILDQEDSVSTEDTKKSLKEPDEGKPAKPRPRTKVNRGSTLDTDHGTSTMKVYPVTEASMNTLKANSKNSSLQYSLVSAFASIVVSAVLCSTRHRNNSGVTSIQSRSSGGWMS